MKFGVDSRLDTADNESQQNCGFMKLRDDVEIPNRATAGSAGFDLCAVIDDGSITIKPHETAMIHTGLAVKTPTGYFGAIFARSGMATKRGLRPANCVGVCDEDYRGEILVALHNDGEIEQTIENGTRVAQIVFVPCFMGEFGEIDSIADTERGCGGFGSTGEK